MKTLIKKSLAVVLSLAVMISMLAVIPVLDTSSNSYATSKTADEAIAWVKSKVGTPIDYDGAYGYQCVDLILAYYHYLGVSTVSGNAKDYATNTLPSGWTRKKGGTPQKGDILVYSGTSSNENGHVAIYEEDKITYHQNFDKHSYVEKITYKYNSLDTPYWGYIRPNWSNINEQTFTIKYNANGGTGTMANTTHTYGVAQALRKNTFTRTGYNFGGWNVRRLDQNTWWYVNASTGGSGWYAQGQQPSGYTYGKYNDQHVVQYTAEGNNCELYAVWVPKTFTLSYNANGGSGTMASTTHTYGVVQALRKNTFTKTGYNFGGWNVKRVDKNTWWYVNGSVGGFYAKGQQPSGYTLGKYNDQHTVQYTADGNSCELYAIWIPKTFTLSYNANGGTGTMASTTHTYGVVQALRKNTFTREGYTFGGWTVKKLDDNTWWYVNGSTGGFYAKGQQPSGYTLSMYNDEHLVQYTAYGNSCELYAVWRGGPRGDIIAPENEPSAASGSTGKPGSSQIAANTLQKGDTLTVGYLAYTVTNAGKKAVSVKLTSKGKKKAKSVTVPGTVKIKGQSCIVKSIPSKGFAKAKKLKTLKIKSPKLTSIGASAFSGDKKLKTLQLTQTTKLTKAGIKKSLKGSNIKVVKVKKSMKKKYTKIFTTKSCGKKVKVK